jgi:ABC-2 type transport system permease protein
MNSIANTLVIFKRELKSYFESPVAYVFLIFFLILSNFFPFQVHKLYERNSADLFFFFFWQPWVYLLLVPAATMGLWAEERKSGTIELLFTMPITMSQAVMGKFLAAWAFMAIAIGLTFPVVLTTTYLGNPDMGPIIAGYAASILLAGTYVSVGMLMSAITRSQVVSFVLSLILCLVLLMIGWEPIMDLFVKWAPNWLVESVAAFGFMPYFESMRRGVISLSDVAYFASFIAFMVVATHVVLDNRKTA